MDVTFTNVLEGARQYFQGIPAGTNAAPNVNYAAPDDADRRRHDAQPPSTSYWPLQQQVARPAYPRAYPEQPVNQTYQFSRPKEYYPANAAYQNQTQRAPVKEANYAQYNQIAPVPSSSSYNYQTNRTTTYYPMAGQVKQVETKPHQNYNYQSNEMYYKNNYQSTSMQYSNAQDVRYMMNQVSKSSNQPPVPSTSYAYYTTTTAATTTATSSTNPYQNKYYYNNAQPETTFVAKKRESPLDLSVKTVRTSADSTLDDRKFHQINYPTYSAYQETFDRGFQQRSVAAPKMDFHPNFSSMRKPDVPNLPRIDFPPAGYGHKTSALYPSHNQDVQKKRPADTAPFLVTSKLPKVETWRQTIDQQIEQKLSSYRQSQKAPSTSNMQYQKAYPQYQVRQSYPPNRPAADKRVLSLLRNSIETKGKKADPTEIHVTAPLQPKPGFHRQNVSPFTPNSIPDNRLHVPKAVDSINYELNKNGILSKTETALDPQNADLDGLAAFLAARIRTKAELKQVVDKEEQEPRKRLFSRCDANKSGLRSSSETSVFDFPDSGSEGEMSALEIQSLGAMRKDRRSSLKSEIPEDDLFLQTCDNFMDQLKQGVGKKRGRRKKIVEADVLAKLETVTKENPIKVEEIKQESDSENETIKQLSNKLNAIVSKSPKKPTFGDGSDFFPGWEQEVYKYKKSLRMPPSLIQVAKPQPARLSTSLPDLDPNSPSSIVAEIEEKPKVKEEPDSDGESSCSINLFGNRSNYDSEGSCSIRSLPNPIKESILDRLLQKCGTKRRKKRKNETPKVIPKAEVEVELLPTPAVEKSTIENFKSAFSNREQFTMVFKSRTRKETQALKQRATIKEVFGEDRPASAPPIINDEEKTATSKLPNRTKGTSLLKSIVDRKVKSELLEDDSMDAKISVISDFDTKSETPSLDGEDSNGFVRKRGKMNRRKFSSGFDYIRKKKKQVKTGEGDTTPKKKRREAALKATPESVQDIQKEIKTWVLNKGIGETHLHRSARLGYTDIAAYCLEKIECSPNPKDNAGYTPLHEACSKGHLDIAKLLLLYGANVSESAKGGIRPLHEAVENGFVEIVRLLLSYGADPKLATYAGLTPLSLANDDPTIEILTNHMNDVEGISDVPWSFTGPAGCFDPKENGYDVLASPPTAEPQSEEEDLGFEVSEALLPNLYTLRGEAPSDRWVLLQDLSNFLKIKSRDALLRQLCPTVAGVPANHRSILRELKMADFMEQAHCCQFLNAGEKINARASKIALVKYTDKVKELLKVEDITITAR